ncbi:MAG: hypothetical protein AAGL89_14705 [Pseudomonadota bacterium]
MFGRNSLSRIALGWFLGLGPISLGIIALAVLGLGYKAQIDQNERNALKAQALIDGPPAMVAIDDFDPALHAHPLDEAVLQAQAVLHLAYHLTIEGDTRDQYAYMVPLVAPDAQSDRKIVGVAMFSDRRFTEDDLTDDLLFGGMTGFGNFGPIVAYNGRMRDLRDFDELTAQSFSDEGLIMPADMPVIWPYLEGRASAHAQEDNSPFSLFSKIAGAIGLFALAKLAFRAKDDDDADLPMPDQRAAEPAPQPDPAVPAAPVEPAVPLWKQRNAAKAQEQMQPSYVAEGDNPVEEVTYAPLAETHAVSDFEKVNVDLAPAVQSDHNLAQPDQPKPRPGRPAYDPIEPVKSSFGLRKVLIGIVGLAFVVLLGSVIFGLVSDVRTQEIANAPVPSAEEALASTLVDIAVPDADPDRHWTEIDLKPMIEWLTAKGLAAAKGDVGAQVTLGLIVGTPIVLLFLLRMFIGIRGSMPRKRLYMQLSD